MFTLSRQSTQRLAGVHPQLVAVVELAITLTPRDFSVGEGLRTTNRQRQLVAQGASQTLNSKHLPQADGHGHAVDLFALDGGKVSWSEQFYYPIATAMAQAAHQLGVPVKWGGCWKVLNTLVPDEKHIRRAVAEYVAERRAAKRKPFLDFVHFEIA